MLPTAPSVCVRASRGPDAQQGHALAQGAGGQLAQEQTVLADDELGLGLHDRALLVERREQRGQLVEVRGHLVRGVVRGRLGDELAELVQVQAQRALGRGQLQLRVRDRLAVARLARLAQDGLDTGVRVLEVHGRVTRQRDHLVQVELVVPRGRGRQVRVLHRADAHVLAVLDDLRLGQADLLRLLADHGGRPLHRLVQQVHQPHRLALTGLERLAVLAQHGAEGQLHGLDLVVQPARPARRLEDHLEVQGLPRVDHVDQLGRAQVAHPVADRGEVGGGVAEAAVGLLDDQRGRVAVLALDVVEEHTERAVGADGDARLLQQLAGLDEHVVVAGLADHVGVLDVHVQLVEDGVEVDLRLVHEPLPEGKGLRLAGLEVHHPGAGTGLELLVGVEEAARSLVQPVEVGHGLLAGDLLGGTVIQLVRVLQQVLDEHAELGAPVADVVATDHLLARELQDLHHRGADHGGTQVADVHLLGHVRLRVVDHRRTGVRGQRHAEAVVGGTRGQGLDDRPVGDGDVQEAGPGDLDLPDQVTGRDGLDHGRRQLARVGLRLLRERQDAVGLEVGPVASSQQGVAGTGVRQGGGECVGDALVDGRSEGRDRGHELPFL